ncbi:excalibur calcium-binding domain-containing protein [Noviherbaspirillum sp. L7-7A]|uniref:excalibur calcium-binding domain-containing protein n=1 Tax=Noviherbaspirillum sp. L7-7A TaxID=2850560 RepID=UPI00201328F0|nr:excalibur calcium-binding domain-containing protein [Noviherbaspirillum sp. L7-7A]
MALVAFTFISDVWAHSGGLDKDGCHTKRSTGDYHCHGGRNGSMLSRSPYAAANEQTSSGNGLAAFSSSRSVFANCAEARAAGAAPVRRGDPGYGPHLDRDNDGVGCESYRRRY